MTSVRANYSAEFIEYMVKTYPVYWLTTHCQDGNPIMAQRILEPFFDERINEIIAQIRPTSWKENKTEAIDFSKPFLWFDDDLWPAEKEDLIKHKALDNLVRINLAKDEYQLKGWIKYGSN
jgi:hypothetical protein